MDSDPNCLETIKGNINNTKALSVIAGRSILVEMAAWASDAIKLADMQSVIIEYLINRKSQV